MSVKEKMKSRILDVETQRNSFVTADDGYVVYWPPSGEQVGRGYQTAEELRLLAEILDEKNKAWDEEVHRELSKKDYKV